MIFVVSGPSGCGKSTLIGRVLARRRDLRFSVSHTTRARRKGERAGRDYFFVDPAAFERMAARGRFAEWAVVHGHRYGTSKAEVEVKGRGGDVVLDVDVQGARSIRALYKDAVTVFVLPPRPAVLRRRLIARGLDAPDAIRARLANARREIERYREFDYLVVNDDLERAAAELEAIIVGQRCRRPAREAALAPILRSFRAAGGR
ncbi:MAG: guanylate kinase [Candidatus Aminicenantes bacterium]|nr:guanylate kinase [Candidatus Aminicenantes bacterium]